MKTLRMDLHTHTLYSHDSVLKLEHYVEACVRKGINCVAVTDHNEIDGAKRMQKMAPFKVIVGEEIRTRDGEISGLFLKERIPPNLSAFETIRRIREQKGLVYIPHPFASGVFMRLKQHVLESVVDEIDIVEGWNSRGLLRADDDRARAFAERHDLPFAAGSDAHSRFELGSAYVEMKDFKTKEQLLRNLREGRLFGRKTNLLFPASSVVLGRARVLGGHRTDKAREKRRTRNPTKKIFSDDF
jgi:predicted metal-dependent phosphoesterase TrpH